MTALVRNEWVITLCKHANQLNQGGPSILFYQYIIRLPDEQEI